MRVTQSISPDFDTPPARGEGFAYKIDFPPAFGYEGLSALLGRSVASLQADRCRKPATLPPACTPPGTKSPRWLLMDVLAWLAQHREAKGKQPVAKVGRPTKSKEIAVRRASAREAEV